MSHEQLEQRLEIVERQLADILIRNERVETDKAWETSRTRTFGVVVITYLTTAVIFYAMGVPNFYLNAIIPTVGYYLSTRTMPLLKKWWLRKWRNGAP